MTSKAQAAFVLTFIPMNQCTVVTIATTVMENYKLNLHLITSLKADFVVVYVCNLHFDISLLMSYDVMWLSLDSFCYTVKWVFLWAPDHCRIYYGSNPFNIYTCTKFYFYFIKQILPVVVLSLYICSMLVYFHGILCNWQNILHVGFFRTSYFPACACEYI